MRILVGVGPDAAEWRARGWTTNDVYPFDGVDIVGPCWQLTGIESGSAEEVLAKGMLEHLTYHEVAQSLAEWKRVLRPGGHVTLEAPDVAEYLREYAKMLSSGGDFPEGRDGGHAGEPADREVCDGIDRWLRRALWGWQRWPGDEHRSGWTEPLLRHYLASQFDRFEIRRMAISFDEDVPVSRVRHLWARAWR